MALRNKRGGLLAGIGLAVAVPTIIWAAVPHVFAPNTAIKSGEVNANFADLDRRMNAMEAKAGLPLVQSGVVSANGALPDWTLDDPGPGERVWMLRVDFESPFATAPRVSTMLNYMDGGPNGVRVDTLPISITGSGFILRVRTWGDSWVSGIRVAWIAHK